MKSCASDRIPDRLIRFHGAQQRCDEGRSSAATRPCHPRNAWQLVTWIMNLFFLAFSSLIRPRPGPEAASSSRAAFPPISRCCLPEETGRNVQGGGHHAASLLQYCHLNYAHFVHIEMRVEITWLRNSSFILYIYLFIIHKTNRLLTG